ncbi:response regulator [Vibrio sinensis]|uniref:Autoinducer 2 sensor kinase/phosphatase LuxQ n=1 Tax=Vibrio sinensis TaxID=2302434 RepID=A0A3A6QRD6_9VIBR|nr:quorum-sensing autoinducer 2 sensor kinase/phosphatase LuxQ [Vibrio sinensis]RJX75460.1 response regulator [Vibrio sinensis]
MLFFKRQSGKDRLATLLTHSLFMTIAVLTVVVLLQNYQVNREVVSQEVERSKRQTSTLVQKIFDYRLKSIEIRQDSFSRNVTLIQALSIGNDAEIGRYFNGFDKSDPDVAPDFRFITSENRVIWSDENNSFYGLSSTQLTQISQEMGTSSQWYLSQAYTSMGMRYLLLRKSPMINIESGEVTAYIHGGIVLNNNFALVSALLDGSNADDIVLTVGSAIIAESDNQAADAHFEWLELYSNILNDSDYMVSRTDLTLDGLATYLTVYTVQDNEHIATLMRGHYLWVAAVVILVIFVALYNRYWLGKRISKELSELMNYTEQSINTKQVALYSGSSISEFNKIGASFQNSFKRLHEQERQFVDLFNYSLSPIILWDSDGFLLRMNPAAERSFRIDDYDEGQYQNLIDRLIPQIKMCAQGATLTGLNIEIGSNVYRWNLSPIIIDSKTTRVIAQAQDITSFIEAERQSQSAREEAEASAQVRADFLAKMSHELRTPLNGILGVTQLLKGSLTNPKDLSQIDVLCNSGEHLLAVLNDILDFSKIEQSKFNIDFSEFNLRELINAIEKVYRPLCEDKQVAFTVTTNVSDNIIVNSDQVRLNQVLFNLLSNAVKFTRQGAISLAVTLSRSANLHWLNIVVEDTGIGIEEHRLAHIFEPFVQAEETITREFGGSGLGLAIVNSLVELLDGDILVHSEFGKGSCFNITIPIEAYEALNQPLNRVLPRDPKTLFDRELNVLLVEDNHTNAFIAQAFCEKYGMKVNWVKDGYQAIEFLKNDSAIDLILMDNQLPNLGGIETTRIIRRDLQFKLPILACTADGMADTKEAFLEAGANSVLVKPIGESALNNALLDLKPLLSQPIV